MEVSDKPSEGIEIDDEGELMMVRGGGERLMKSKMGRQRKLPPLARST